MNHTNESAVAAVHAAWKAGLLPEPQPNGSVSPVSKSPLDVQVGGDHYKQHAIQPIEFIFANNIPFIEGNCIKYLTRWRDKGGIKDLEKVKHYIDLLIHLEKTKSAK